MAQNNADYNGVLSCVQDDRVTPIYLTADGTSGGTPLHLELWLRQSPGGPVVAEFSTVDNTLVILEPPNDNQISWHIPFTTMQTLAANLYYGDVLALVSDTSRLGYGSLLFPVEQGSTEME